MVAPSDKPILVLANESSRRELAGLLRKWGYRTVGAGSADEAIEMLAGTGVRCTLVDLTGDGAGAAEALGRLAREGAELGPVILLCDGHDLAVADQNVTRSS
jgi:CheY-like chemotaxis protein